MASQQSIQKLHASDQLTLPSFDQHDRARLPYHLEIVEILSACQITYHDNPVILAPYDLLIGRNLPAFEFKAIASQILIIHFVLDFDDLQVITEATIANNGLIHDLFAQKDPQKKFVHYKHLENKGCDAYLRAIIGLGSETKSSYVDFELSSTVALLFDELSRHYQRRVSLISSYFPCTEIHYANAYTRAGVILNYLNENVAHATLVKTAQHFGYDPKYFSRLCKKLFNKNFLTLRQTIRLGIAENLLSLTNKSISEIGHIIGYTDSGNFYHLFHRTTGMTPYQYRLKHRQTR